MSATPTTKPVVLPLTGQTVRFQDRQKMKRGHPLHRMVFAEAFSPPVVSLPLDWTKNNTLSFPIYGNDKYGDCMEAAAAHGDNTWTGNLGTEFPLNQQALIRQYLSLSGGDNGLDEMTLIQGWKAGLAGVTQASILAAADVDPTNNTLCQFCLSRGWLIIFMLDVPDKWINSFTGSGNDVWDGGVSADLNNGHGVLWNGCDTTGYKIQTWGSHVKVTFAGVKVCDPSAFAVISLRNYDAQGFSMAGYHYTADAVLWQQMTGQSLPPSPFPTPGPAPVPVPTPVPSGPTELQVKMEVDAELTALASRYRYYPSYAQVIGIARAVADNAIHKVFSGN